MKLRLQLISIKTLFHLPIPAKRDEARGAISPHPNSRIEPLNPARMTGPDLGERRNNFPLSHWKGFAQNRNSLVGTPRLRRPRPRSAGGKLGKSGFGTYSVAPLNAARTAQARHPYPFLCRAHPMGEGRGGRETFDVRPLMLDVLCRKDPSQFLSPVRAKDDSPREGCAAAALGNDPNNTSFFVIPPRERRMTKKAPLATTTLSHLLRSFLQIMLNVRGSRVHYFQPTLPTALRKTSPFFPVFVFVLGLALASLNVSAQ